MILHPELDRPGVDYIDALLDLMEKQALKELTTLPKKASYNEADEEGGHLAALRVVRYKNDEEEPSR